MGFLDDLLKIAGGPTRRRRTTTRARPRGPSKELQRAQANSQGAKDHDRYIRARQKAAMTPAQYRQWSEYMKKADSAKSNDTKGYYYGLADEMSHKYGSGDD